MKPAIRTLGLSGLGFFLILAFQNCGKALDFQTMQSASFSSQTSESGLDLCDLDDCGVASRECRIENGSGDQFREGNEFSECTVTNCDEDYHIDGNTCVADSTTPKPDPELEPTPIPSTSPTPTNDWPTLAQKHIDTAKGIKLAQFIDSGQGRVGAQSSWGMAPEVLAYAAFKGSTSADKRLMEQVDSALSSNYGIFPHSRTTSQFEMRVQTMLVIVRYTPRIWNSLPTAKKNQITTAMKAMLFASAFVASDANPKRSATGQLSLHGVVAITRSYGTNISFGATNGKLLVGMAYFGNAKTASDLLENFNMAAFRNEISQNFGKSHRLYKAFNWRNEGNTSTTGTIVGPSSVAPTDSEVERALHGWKFYGKTMLNWKGILETGMEKALGQKIQSGLNDGAGATEDKSRGKIISGASGTPWLNTPNAMLYELNGKDGEGQRSSMGYGTWTARVLIDTFMALEISGMLNKNDPAIADILIRFAKALDVWRYFSKQGYYSWAHGGQSGGGGGSSAVWPAGGPSDWYVPMNEALWFEVLRVKFDLPSK